MINHTIEYIEKIRENSPLVHNITNFVVMNSSANILLSQGASPVMAHSIEEVEEMVTLAGALVLNIGTLSPLWIDSMIEAAKIANKKGIPVILDPVGSGATSFRTDSVKWILEKCIISVLRGNASEIMSLSSNEVKTRGVDSSIGISQEIIDFSKYLAEHKNMIVAVSGEKDLITDGKDTYIVKNGVNLMTKVTGLGCGLSATVGSFCAVSEGNYLESTASAFLYYGICGNIAYEISQKPGSFYTAFIDSLYSTGDDEIKKLADISKI